MREGASKAMETSVDHALQRRQNMREGTSRCVFADGYKHDFEGLWRFIFGDIVMSILCRDLKTIDR